MKERLQLKKWLNGITNVLFCLCLLGFSVWGASDQVVEKVLDIFEADSLPGSNVAVTADSDSGG